MSSCISRKVLMTLICVASWTIQMCSSGNDLSNHQPHTSTRFQTHCPSHRAIVFSPESTAELKTAVGQCMEDPPRPLSPQYEPLQSGSDGIVLTPFTHRGTIFSNRVGLSPLTRSRASPEGIVNDLHVEYYTQRATAGFIITEATAVAKRGHGWYRSPGIWLDEQVRQRLVTQICH